MHLFRAIDPTGIAIDGAGNAWIANYVDPGRVSEFSSAGVALSPSSGYTGGGGDYGGWSFAIDSSVARVERETGLSLEIIGRETEARLAVSGCASLIDKQSDYVLVFDIGGGSSEFVWLNLAMGRPSRRISIEDRLRAQDSIEAWTSLPFGVVTLAERFGKSFAEGHQFEEMVTFVQGELKPFSDRNSIAAKIAASGAHLLGTSGTVTTIAGVYLGLAEYHRAKVDGCWLSAQSIRQVSKRIAGMNYEQRAAEPCIGRERADLILAGCAIMEAMLRVWPVKSLRVADRGLREGILATLIAEDLIGERNHNAKIAASNGGPNAGTHTHRKC